MREWIHEGATPCASAIKITTPEGVVIFMDTTGDLTCSAEMNPACAEILAFGKNACTGLLFSRTFLKNDKGTRKRNQ